VAIPDDLTQGTKTTLLNTDNWNKIIDFGNNLKGYYYPSVAVVSDKVGIGVANPGTGLDVLGAHVSGTGMARFKGSGIYGFMSFDTTGSGESGLLMKNNGTLVAQFGQSGGTDLYIYNCVFSATYPVFNANSSGDVGIGGNMTLTTLAGAALVIKNAGWRWDDSTIR
jgi:hypothetical protein